MRSDIGMYFKQIALIHRSLCDILTLKLGCLKICEGDFLDRNMEFILSLEPLKQKSFPLDIRQETVIVFSCLTDEEITHLSVHSEIFVSLLEILSRH